MKRYTFIILSFLVLVVIFFVWYSRRIINAFGYTLQEIDFKNLSLKSISGTITMTLTNPLLPDYVLKSLVLDVYVNGVLLEQLNQNDESISKNGAIDLKLKFDVNPDEILDLNRLNAVLSQNKTITYKGTAKIKKYITFNVPIDYSYTL